MHLILEADFSKKPQETLLTQNNTTWCNLEDDFSLIAEEIGLNMEFPIYVQN
jgi:hypothetical protein